MFYWDNKATLVVKDTQAADAGEYKCVVSNRLGSVESSCNLSILGKFLYFHTKKHLKRYIFYNLLAKMMVITLLM